MVVLLLIWLADGGDNVEMWAAMLGHLSEAINITSNSVSIAGLIA